MTLFATVGEWLATAQEDAEDRARELRGAVDSAFETALEGDVPPPPEGLSEEEAEALRQRLIETGADPGLSSRVNDAINAPAAAAEGVLDRVSSLGKWLLIGAAGLALLLVVGLGLWIWGQVRIAGAVAPALAKAVTGGVA